MEINLIALLDIARRAATEAGGEILRIYGSGDFKVEAKEDSSPLTRADKASHDQIVRDLKDTGLPILSEEGKEISFDERQRWEYFWMIDPLDGTKEFIKRNGEFTVNIALIHKGKPVLGVVYVPVTGDMFHAAEGEGAFRNDKRISVNQFNFNDRGLRVVASRSHMNEETERFVAGLNDPEIVSRGSSLKLLMVASGEADLYPRYAPTMEWDTAAAQVVVEEAGGFVRIKDTDHSVVYNKQDLLNPYFLVAGATN